MRMNAKKKVLCSIIIVSLLASLIIESGFGATVSYYPLNTNDDGFITQVGNHFRDTPYLPLQSATTDIIDGLRFRSLNITQDAKINNATLFVRTLHTYDTGLVYATIYGVDENDAYAFNSSGDFSRPYTTNHVVWNVSDVNGYAWHNVSVTNIVQEIISRYGWRTGNSLAFIILSDSGEPRREFATIDNNVAWRPRLDITYDETPPDPSSGATPPFNDTDSWLWEFNETYRGYEIWRARFININRTGYGADVNWNTVNMTALGEVDGGANIFPRNDTWTEAIDWNTPVVGSIFNDTGAANVNSFFLRWKIDMTRVHTSVLVATDPIPFVFALSTNSPTTSDGMAYGNVGEWVGLIAVVDKNKTNWRIWARERVGGNKYMTANSQWFSEDDTRMLYFEAAIQVSGVPYIIYQIYDDPGFTNRIFLGAFVLTIASGPFRYAQVLAGDSLGTSSGADDFDCYTFLESQIELDEIFITYPNGTLVIPDPIDGDPEDIIDDLLGGADPEDPETDKYGDALTKNRWKTFIFVIGITMFLGTPMFAMISKPSTGRWIMVLFVSLCGLSILWSLIYM